MQYNQASDCAEISDKFSSSTVKLSIPECFGSLTGAENLSGIGFSFWGDVPEKFFSSGDSLLSYRFIVDKNN